MSVCAVVWCSRTAVARGLCKSCYSRWRRGVSPTVPTRRYMTKADKERIRSEVTRRREAGEGVADIAAAVGMNSSTLGKWLREWGVNPGTDRAIARAPKLWQPWTQEDIAFATTRTDLTLAERAATLGRSVAAVEEIIRSQRRSRRRRQADSGRDS